MGNIASNTVALPVSIIGGPSASSAAHRIWEVSNSNARVGLLAASPPASTPPDLSSRLFRLTTASPAEISDQVAAIAREQGLDHLIIQGDTSQPIMAYASLFAIDAGQPNSTVRLTTVAMAITPRAVLDLLLPDRPGPPPGPVCLIVEQLEFADTIFLDTTIEESDLNVARAVLAALNPSATVSALSEETGALLKNDGPAFDFTGALEGAAWRRLIEDDPAPVFHPSGVCSFAYHARRPFHPERLWQLLHNDLRKVIRAKGFLWLATRMDLVGGLNLAGTEVQCGGAGEWWATRDRETRDREMSPQSRLQWQEPFGDRRQAIAFTTIDLSPEKVRAQLDASLLTDDEMAAGAERWRQFPDPFPSWSPHHHHECEHDHHECDHDHGSHSHDCCHN